MLKCEQGFVGPKGVRMECNKANYETIQVVRGPKGVVYFKGNNTTAYFLVVLPIPLALWENKISRSTPGSAKQVSPQAAIKTHCLDSQAFPNYDTLD